MGKTAAKTAAKLRILVVEDEESIRGGLCDVLAYHGYSPTAVETGEEGLEVGRSEELALVILDLMLPGIHGLEVCRRLRGERPGLPILMLTAKGSEDDVVRGLRAGADDYVTKPFSIRELVARVEALLRRSGAFDGDPESFTFGPWQVDTNGLRAVDGARSLNLTRRELELLALFAREAGRVVSRRTLLREVWGFANVDEIETRTVDVHIAKLRKKIDDSGRSLIETVRGAGYRAIL
ncbi:MAG: response regulator transcription factor [Thermoanaerobaculia bacterium]